MSTPMNSGISAVVCDGDERQFATAHKQLTSTILKFVLLHRDHAALPFVQPQNLITPLAYLTDAATDSALSIVCQP